MMSSSAQQMAGSVTYTDAPAPTGAALPTYPLSAIDNELAQFFANDSKGFPVLEQGLRECGCPVCQEAIRIMEAD